MKRLLCVPAVVVLLALAGGALGQPGPVGQPGGGGKGGTGPVGQPGGGGKGGTGPVGGQAKGGTVQAGGMTAERAAELLRKQGHQVTVENVNGAKTVIANITKNDWNYVLEFEFAADQKSFNVIAPLSGPATKFSSEQLLALMKKSYEFTPPMHFSYRATDQRICLEDPMYVTTGMTEQTFNQIVNNVCQQIRDTHALWDSSRWPVAGDGAK